MSSISQRNSKCDIVEKELIEIKGLLQGLRIGTERECIDNRKVQISAVAVSQGTMS